MSSGTRFTSSRIFDLIFNVVMTFVVSTSRPFIRRRQRQREREPQQQTTTRTLTHYQLFETLAQSINRRTNTQMEHRPISGHPLTPSMDTRRDDDENDDDGNPSTNNSLPTGTHAPLHPQDAVNNDVLYSSTKSKSKTSSHWLSPVIYNILAVETGERFAYFGFRAVLVLYFTLDLHFSEPQAISYFAFVTCFAYLSPVLGAILADGFWGKYVTIWRFGVLYVVGLFILTVGAALNSDSALTIRRTLSFVGLFLVCLGTGGIKPVVSAFGADQVAAQTTTTNATITSNGEAVTLVNDSDALEFREDNVNGSDGIFKRGSEGNGDEEHPVVVDPRETIVTNNQSTQAQGEDREEQVRSFFNYFYFCINVGALVSIAIVPIVRGHAGFGAAFLLPTLFMITAIALFVSKRKEYVHHLPGKDGSSLVTTFALCWWLFRLNVLQSSSFIRASCPAWLRPSSLPPGSRRGQHMLVSTTDRDEQEIDGAETNGNDSASDGTSNHDNSEETIRLQLDDAAQALHVLPVMAMLPIFWCLYDQQSSVWTLQANRMELNGLQPEQLNVVNPLEIMLFIPLFDRIIYPKMQSFGINIQPLRRMAWGMILTSIAFFISGRVEQAIQYREENPSLPKVNVFWQIPQITILSVGEIFVSVTGLEFSYATSPVRLKAFLMAMYLLTTAVGDFVGGILYSTVFADMNLATAMDICAVLMILNLGLFLFVARWYKRTDYHKLRSASPNNELEIPERGRMT